MVYWQIILKTYAINLQYRLSHFINNLGSIIFGVVFIAIWMGVLEGREGSSPYSSVDMIHYIVFNQCLLWLTTFLSPGLNIHMGVRTGAVATAMSRPVDFFLYTISQEAGKIVYNFMYRSIPIGIVFALTVGFYLPTQPLTYVWTVCSVIIAISIGLNLFYLTGISSFWTTEISWAHFFVITCIFGLGGQMIPINLLPESIASVVSYLPFAGVLSYPTMIYLEKIQPGVISIQLVWALVLTFVNLFITRQARRHLEIQGG